MSEGLSAYLNGLRALAALLVLSIHATGHLSAFGVTIGSLGIHHDAVTVFFVLSGFVVAFAAGERDRRGGVFTINRAARIASVAVPAILLTIAIDLYVVVGTGTEIPDAYQLASIPKYAAICASMTGYIWDSNIFCFSNGPYWSLAYEAWFYGAFGVAAFAPTRALKIVGTLAVLMLMGPNMVLLMPCWLMGVCVYWLSRRYLAPKAISWFLLLAPLATYVFLKQYDLNTYLAVNIAAPIQRATGHVFYAAGGFSYDWIIATLIALNIYGACGVFTKARPAPLFQKVASYLAGISFSVYLYQSPLFLLIGVSLPPSVQGWPRAVILISIVFLCSAALAQVTEAKKGRVRQLIRDGVASLSKRSVVVVPTVPPIR